MKAVATHCEKGFFPGSQMPYIHRLIAGDHLHSSIQWVLPDLGDGAGPNS